MGLFGTICVLLCSCSTIVKGTKHQVSMATPGVQGALCTMTSPAIGTRTVQTPGNIVLPKSKHDVSVACPKQCYTDGVGVLASETEIMTAGNVVFRHDPHPQLQGVAEGQRRADGKHAGPASKLALPSSQTPPATYGFRFPTLWSKRALTPPYLPHNPESNHDRHCHRRRP
jgi:hypothetical protein